MSPAAQTTAAFFSPPPTNIELVYPSTAGTDYHHLEKKGGLHHLCFRPTISMRIARLRARGYQFLADAPILGAHGSRVIFIHPEKLRWRLIEINQPAADHH